MPQHLTGVRAAQLLSRADVKGDHAGSTELSFVPGEVKGGSFLFDIGTAGSTMLVLQTLIPALIFTKEKTEIVLTGGTHVPFSPSFHYVWEVLVPFLEKLGIKILLTIESYGFYPKGGGKIRAVLFPADSVRPVRITDRGRMISLKGYSGVGNLPLSIAERQRKGLMEKVHREIGDLRCHEEVELLDLPTPGQGTFLFLKAEFENSVAGFTSLGERGKKAEAVGEEAAGEFIQYYSSGAAFDPNLPDQIVLYLAMADGESEFTTSRITQHLKTNLWAIRLFHEFRYFVEGEIGKPGRVKIG
jgi:RNA 3'-terminal phosphate cyclase (ATP)